jgi:hypothetical protein
MSRNRWGVKARCFAAFGLLLFRPYADVLAQDGVTNSPEEIAAVRALAEAGDSETQFALGAVYDHGLGGPEDDQEAAKWYRKAADQGHAWAQFRMGVMCQNGEGVPKDDKEAINWYRMAAAQGNARAECALGVMYANGEGVEMNPVEAVKWYRKAANQGDPAGQLGLGLMYSAGEGVPQDDKKAIKWYRIAADQGFALAQNNLGVMHDKGRGVPEDDKEAVKWYRMAAEQGNAEAQFNLGVMYLKGEGVPEDFVEAYKWYNLAAAQGVERAVVIRNMLKVDMTPEQIAEAQRLATAFAPLSMGKRYELNNEGEKTSSAANVSEPDANETVPPKAPRIHTYMNVVDVSDELGTGPFKHSSMKLPSGEEKATHFWSLSDGRTLVGSFTDGLLETWTFK